MKENERELSEEEITRKRFQIDDWKLQKESNELSIAQFQKMLELDMPNKKLRSEIHKAEENIRVLASNIKVFEKQCRERKEVSYLPEVEVKDE
jgi:SMC interacting uncharacterized protein involved in chromosome segregation